MIDLQQSNGEQTFLRKSTRRPGVVLIAVLVCVAVASTIMAGIVVSGLRERRQFRHESQMEQTRWMLEAGLVHGVGRCSDDKAYRGETIELSPALSEHYNAKIEIQVNAMDDGARAVTATAIIQGNTMADSSTRRSGRVIVPSE